MGKDHCVWSLYTFILLKKMSNLQVKKKWDNARALCPGVHVIVPLEKRERKVCCGQRFGTRSGRKAHHVKGIELTGVKAVWSSLPRVWVVQLRYFTCVADGWIAKYNKKVATKSQKEPWAQVYKKALKQQISFQHGGNWKQCNVTCSAKSGPKIRICCLI